MVMVPQVPANIMVPPVEETRGMQGILLKVQVAEMIMEIWEVWEVWEVTASRRWRRSVPPLLIILNHLNLSTGYLNDLIVGIHLTCLDVSQY